MPRSPSSTWRPSSRRQRPDRDASLPRRRARASTGSASSTQSRPRAVLVGTSSRSMSVPRIAVGLSAHRARSRIHHQKADAPSASACNPRLP
jgi:hypothetical protein